VPNDSLDFSIRNLGNGADHGIDVLWSARIDGDSTSDDPFVTDRTACAEAVAAYFNDPNDPTLSIDLDGQSVPISDVCEAVPTMRRRGSRHPGSTASCQERSCTVTIRSHSVSLPESKSQECHAGSFKNIRVRRLTPRIAKPNPIGLVWRRKRPSSHSPQCAI
jgi:hypothetical protein